MDIVTDIPESTTSGYTGILVIVDRLTKMAVYLPCRNHIDSSQLGQILFEHVIGKRGKPDNLVANYGKEFTSRFWNRVCSLLSINHKLSTAFYQQTNGQTEQHNQTMGRYLQVFSYPEQDNWVGLLPFTEFVYNNSVHHSTWMTSFWANYHCPLPMQYKPLKASSNMRLEILPACTLMVMDEPHWLLHGNLFKAQVQQSILAGG
jgi:hypothetical protein